MKTVINLSNNTELTYGDNVSDLLAVCQSYCLDNKLSSWFFSMVQNKTDYTEKLPITIGSQTIACGDWCVVKTDSPELKLF